MRQVSPIQAPEVPESPVVLEAPHTTDASKLVPSLTIDVAEPTPPLDGESTEDAELEAFEGGPVELSLLPLYLDHTSGNIWMER